MKKVTFILGAAVVAVLASCGGKATAEAGDADSAAKAGKGAATLNIDKAASLVEWKGYKSIGYDHFGTLNLSEGTLSVENGNITAGEFTIDMASLNSLDTKDDTAKQAKLNGHLKSEDFFGVSKYPTAKFVVTKSEVKADDKGNTHLISGNLTIRDVTKNVSFPAKVTIDENGATAEGAVTINRLDWGINYDKKNLDLGEAAIAKIKDGVVKNAVDITIKLKATK